MPSVVSAVQTWSQLYGRRVAHLVTLINIQTLQEIRGLPYCINAPHTASRKYHRKYCIQILNNITTNGRVCGDKQKEGFEKVTEDTSLNGERNHVEE